MVYRYSSSDFVFLRLLFCTSSDVGGYNHCSWYFCLVLLIVSYDGRARISWSSIVSLPPDITFRTRIASSLSLFLVAGSRSSMCHTMSLILFRFCPEKSSMLSAIYQINSSIFPFDRLYSLLFDTSCTLSSCFDRCRLQIRVSFCMMLRSQSVALGWIVLCRIVLIAAWLLLG